MESVITNLPLKIIFTLLLSFFVSTTKSFSNTFSFHHRESRDKNNKSDASKNVLFLLPNDNTDENTDENTDDSVFHSVASRRVIISTSISFIVSTQLSSRAFSQENDSIPFGNTTELFSLSEAVTLIENSCNRKFLNSVVASDYNFLYRGIPPSEAKQPSLRIESPDLFDPKTYESEDATKIFKKLEKGKMSNSPVKPSNGHLAVTCPRAASQWGTAASVWPLGENVHFAWFKNGGSFWPRDNMNNDILIVDGIECGQVGLEDALRGDSVEIMFSSDTFLVVPFALDEKLKTRLRKTYII